jgi:hypothetical protein
MLIGVFISIQHNVEHTVRGGVGLPAQHSFGREQNVNSIRYGSSLMLKELDWDESFLSNLTHFGPAKRKTLNHPKGFRCNFFFLFHNRESINLPPYDKRKASAKRANKRDWMERHSRKRCFGSVFSNAPINP